MHPILRHGLRRISSILNTKSSKLYAPHPCSFSYRSRLITSRAGLAPVELEIRDPSPPEQCSSNDSKQEEEDEDIYADEISEFGTYSIILPEEPYVFGTDHIERRTVPKHIVRPPYVGAPSDAPYHGDPYSGDGRVFLGGDDETKLRAAAKLAKHVLEYAGTLAKVGSTTDEIDLAVLKFIVSHNAYPSPLGYSGFPKACCTSVNNVIAHGIPDGRPLEDGDIVNIDITVYLDGYHGDTSRTFLIGDVDEPGQDLVRVTNLALTAGLEVCKPGIAFRAIARAMHNIVLSQHRPYSISPMFTGHGIGRVFHRPPWVVHAVNHEPEIMLPGHCFTIEPCVIQGSRATGWTFPDGWTASTENCARSAQAEHMVLITEDGAEVLTS